MSNDDIYVENDGNRYRLYTWKDFIKFKELAFSNDSEWKQVYKSGTTTTETHPQLDFPEEPKSNMKIIRVKHTMPNVKPIDLYNAMHDVPYRKVFDQHMIEGYNICQLDPRNDIGYYSCKSGAMVVSNRDFCNQRCWMEFTNGDFIILNFSVKHNKCPEYKGFVRATSIIGGYYIQSINNGEGCQIIYISNSDLKGLVPAWIINSLTTVLAPKMCKSIEDAATKYPQWCIEHNITESDMYWRTPKINMDNGNEEM